jgi:hypothetical protein
MKRRSKVMKKILAIALALIMVCSTTVIAFASVMSTPSVGTIEFIDGEPPAIVFPSDEWEIALNRDLDFGVQVISSEDQNYSSYADSRTPNDRLSGVQILNESIRGDWVLQVEIGHFVIYEDYGDGFFETMHGFELELVVHDEFTNRPLTPQVVNNVTLEAEQAPQTIMTITPVSTIGANWEGFLEVLGGTVLHTGFAQAEMTWSILIPA